MNKKQVEEVIKAIIDHKYSWACVLILRFHGYDPIDYIPYRTYIRLLKDNYQIQKKDTSDPTVKTLDFNDFKSNKMHLVEQKKG